MAFRIGNRVVSAIGLMLFLFLVTSSVAHLLTQRVKDDVYRLVGVDDRKRSAAVDLRAQLDAFARTAVAYAYGRDAAEEPICPTAGRVLLPRGVVALLIRCSRIAL